MSAQFITTVELAAHLSCSTEKVYRMARLGEIPFIRVGRGYRFNADAVVAKLAEPSRPWQQSNHSRGRRRAG